MPGPVFMAGDRVALTTVEEADLDAFVRARSDPDLRVPLGIDSAGNRDDVEEFFEETISSEDSFWFVVAVDGETVGSVTFTEVNESAGDGELSYWILPEHQGEGYASDAVALLLEYGFDELRLHRVTADCYATNDASRGLLETLGFSREGRFRDAAFLEGEYEDVLRYGLLEGEWREG